MIAVIFKLQFPIHMKQLVPLLIVSIALTSGLSAPAQDLAAVSSGVSADLQKALADLAEARKQVEAERLPRARSPNWSRSLLIARLSTPRRSVSRRTSWWS
jgi:hypothetical protein